MKSDFGASSNAQLATVHPQLATMARRALELSDINFRVLQGIRTPAEQLAAFQSGHSKIKSGGRHQFGCAIDVIAIDPKTGASVWKPISLYTKIRNAFQKASKELGIPLRTLESIGDYGHFELPKSYMPDNWKTRVHVVTPAAANVAGAVHLGAKGARVREAQELLFRDGLAVDVDGVFGPSTRDAVKAFQKKHKLKVTGAVDAATWKQLNIRRIDTKETPGSIGPAEAVVKTVEGRQGAATAGSGLTVLGAKEGVQEATTALSGTAGTSNTLDMIYVGLTILGIALTLGGVGWLAYGWWRAGRTTGVKEIT